MKEKYLFLKKIHSNILIIFQINGKYITFSNDLEILKYIKCKNLIKKLEQREISYMLLERDLTPIKEKNWHNEEYQYLLKKIWLIKIIRGDYCE